MTDLQAFREETKDWLETNCPPEMKKPGDVCWGGRNPQFSHPDQEIWLERMGDKGLTCPTWPSKYGGGGLSKEENQILQEEMNAIGARSPLDIMVNPRLHIINKVATNAVALVIKLPAVLENIKLSWETPIPSAPPSDFCIRTSNTNIAARMILITSNTFSMKTK